MRVGSSPGTQTSANDVTNRTTSSVRSPTEYGTLEYLFAKQLDDDAQSFPRETR
jgi:hypothetical protein